MVSSSPSFDASLAEQTFLLQQPWFRGLRRLVQRRIFLYGGAACLILLLIVGCVVTSSHAPLRTWFAMTLASTGLGFFAIFLAWLYEHARSEEILEQWIVDLPSTLGRMPASPELMRWIDDLEVMPAASITLFIRKPLLKQIQQRLLVHAEELAVASVVAQPLEWHTHADLATSLSRLYQLDGEDEVKLRALEELAILQTLAPQDPECWSRIVECATDLEEDEVELHARERLSLLRTDREPTVALGRALFRCGLSGRAFALYRQLLAEDPEAAQQLIQEYRPQLSST
ncbi:MAG: hypothetical protein ACOYKZ_02215 [Chlamydiia bacterium]